MKKIIISGIVAVAASALIGCETVPTNTTNVKVNGTNVANNTAVVLNNNTNVVTSNVTVSNSGSTVWTNYNSVTKEQYEKDRARWDAERGTSTIGTGANDSWIWFKTKGALATTNDLRDSTINVDVANDVITLRGTVATPEQRTKAESVAKGIDGNKGVKNELKVQSGDSMSNQMVNGNTSTNANR